MNQAPSGERDIRKGDGEPSRRATEDLLRTLVFMQLYNKAQKSAKRPAKKKEGERELTLADSEERVDISFDSASKQLALPPGGPAFQLEGKDEAARLEGRNPKKLRPAPDDVSVMPSQPAPYSGDRIQLNAERPDIDISVRVGGKATRGSQETIGSAIDRDFNLAQKEQLSKAINNENVEQEVVIFAQDKNNSANKIGFVRSPEVDRGWLVQNDSDQYRMSSEQVSIELNRMKSQEASEMRGVIKDAVKADNLFIDGQRYHVHVMDEQILITDKGGRSISGEEYERAAQSASDISRSKGLGSRGNKPNKNPQKQRGKQLEP